MPHWNSTPYAGLIFSILVVFLTISLFYGLLLIFFKYSQETIFSIFPPVIEITIFGIIILFFGILLLLGFVYTLKHPEDDLKYIKGKYRKSSKICFMSVSIISLTIELAIVIITIHILTFSYYLLFL